MQGRGAVLTSQLTAADHREMTAYDLLEPICAVRCPKTGFRGQQWSPVLLHEAGTESYRIACSLARANKEWAAAVRLYRSSQQVLIVNGLDDAALRVIARDCPLLRKFSFKHVREFKQQWLEFQREEFSFSDAAVLAFFEACPLLEVALLGCAFHGMSARTMTLLSRTCSHIVELDLFGLEGSRAIGRPCSLTSTSLSSFLTGCGRLRKLQLSALPCVTDEIVMCIDALHPSLSVLHLWRVPISNASLKGSEWRQLQELSLNSTLHMTTGCFNGVYFSRLTTLAIGHMHVEGFTPLATACPCLVALKLTMGTTIACSLSDLVLPLLSILDLSENSDWPSQAYDGLSAENLPRLSSLSLNGGDISPLITSNEIQNFALRCQQLTEIDLNWTDENRGVVDDAAVEAIAQHCVNLKALCLAGASITDVALHACTRLTGLSFLHLTSVPGVTDAGLRAVAVGCPLLWSFGGKSFNQDYADDDDNFLWTLDGYLQLCKDVLSHRPRGHNGLLTTPFRIEPFGHLHGLWCRSFL